MTVWPAKNRSASVANSRIALMTGSHAQMTVSGVRTSNTPSVMTWIQKQPSPGPRTGSSGSPL